MKLFIDIRALPCTCNLWDFLDGFVITPVLPLNSLVVRGFSPPSRTSWSFYVLYISVSPHLSLSLSLSLSSYTMHTAATRPTNKHPSIYERGWWTIKRARRTIIEFNHYTITSLSASGPYATRDLCE
jgi:hypothetical protein